MLSFWLKMESLTTSGFIHVGVMSNNTDITTFDTIMTIAPTSTDWIYYEIPLSLTRYSGNGYFIAFCHTSGSGNYYMDDITVEYIPTCTRPSSLTCANITSNSVDIGWQENGGATSWDIEYGSSGFTHGNGTTILATDTFYTISGLTDVNEYDVYVRADCGNGDTSHWFGPITFTTSCLPSPLPIIENFDSYDDQTTPTCWWNSREFLNSTSYAYVYSTYYYSGTKSLKIGTNSGSSSYYGYIETNQLNVHDFNNVLLSFKGKKNLPEASNR